jgi:hypothetical protein
MTIAAVVPWKNAMYVRRPGFGLPHETNAKNDDVSLKGEINMTAASANKKKEVNPTYKVTVFDCVNVLMWRVILAVVLYP